MIYSELKDSNNRIFKCVPRLLAGLDTGIAQGTAEAADQHWGDRRARQGRLGVAGTQTQGPSGWREEGGKKQVDHRNFSLV